MDVSTHAVVVSAAATLPLPEAQLGAIDLVVAADGGVRAALALGRLDLVVGDLDSVTADDLARAESAGACVERHPREKDATDLELAIDAARARGVTRITVVDSRAGRLDHFVAATLLLAHRRYAALEMRAVVDGALITVVPAHGTRPIDGAIGELVTLVPVGGDAHDVTTHGLAYPLRGETLASGTTRGVSNEIVELPVLVSVGAGALLVLQPEVAR